MYNFLHSSVQNAQNHALELSIAGWKVVIAGMQVTWYVD